MYLIHYIFCNCRFNSSANVIHVQTLNFFLANVGLISRQLLHKTACMSFNSFVNVWVIKWRILMATQVIKRRVVFSTTGNVWFNQTWCYLRHPAGTMLFNTLSDSTFGMLVGQNVIKFNIVFMSRTPKNTNVRFPDHAKNLEADFGFCYNSRSS